MTTLQSLEVTIKTIPMRIPFRHARGKRTANEVLTVRLTTTDQRVGMGATLLRPYLTGETVDDARRFLEGDLWDRLRNTTVPASISPHAFMEPHFLYADALRRNGAFAAVDIAVHELLRDHSVAPEVRSQHRAAVVGLMPASLRRALAHAYGLFGFSAVKIKVDRQTDDLVKLRNILRTQFLYVDANSSLEAQDWQRLSCSMRAAGIDVIEDPTGNPDDWSAVAQSLKQSCIADESLCTLSDAQKHLALGTPRWNLRLAKNGGPTGVSYFARLAQERNITCHLGCLVGEPKHLNKATAWVAHTTPPFTQEEAFSQWLVGQ